MVHQGKHQIQLQLGYQMNFISKILVAEKCGSADTTKENCPKYCPIHILFRLIRMTICETTFPSGIMGKEYHGQAILHVHVYLSCCVLIERITAIAQSPHHTDLQAD